MNFRDKYQLDLSRVMTVFFFDKIEYSKALQEDPSGAKCCLCGENNYFYDDCGWFYPCSLMGGAVCEKCWHKNGWTTGER
jgi:hypothetical protein